jgi:hypothetical protein
VKVHRIRGYGLHPPLYPRLADLFTERTENPGERPARSRISRTR